MDSLGQRIRLLRGENSQTWLAKKLGIPPTTLSNYEHNKSELNFTMIESITRIFQVNTDWLLFGRGPIKPETSESPANILPQTVLALEEKLKRLEARLDAAEDERRELSMENRQLHRDKAELLYENGQLRMAIVRLEERQRKYNLTHSDAAENSGVV